MVNLELKLVKMTYRLLSIALFWLIIVFWILFPTSAMMALMWGGGVQGLLYATLPLVPVILVSVNIYILRTWGRRGYASRLGLAGVGAMALVATFLSPVWLMGALLLLFPAFALLMLGGNILSLVGAIVVFVAAATTPPAHARPAGEKRPLAKPHRGAGEPVLTRGRIWVSVALIAVVVGYFTPDVFPAYGYRFAISPVQLLVEYGFRMGSTLTYLLLLPLFLAIAGWIDYWRLESLRGLRYGFNPALLMGIIYFLGAFVFAWGGWWYVPTTSVPLFAGAFASNRAKRMTKRRRHETATPSLATPANNASTGELEELA
jgi:MFS family permease